MDPIFQIANQYGESSIKTEKCTGYFWIFYNTETWGGNILDIVFKCFRWRLESGSMDWCVSLRPAISPERLWSNSVFSLTNVGSGNCAAALWGPIFYTVLEKKMKKLETCLIWIKKVVLGINGCKHISDAPLISKLRWDIGIKQYAYDFKTTLVQLRFVKSGKNEMSRLLLWTAEKCTVR